MKLVFLVDNYPPIVDGVGDYTHNMATELYNQGHEVHVICAAKEGIQPSADGVKVWPIVPRWNNSSFNIAINKIHAIRPDWVLVQFVPYSYHTKGMPLWLPGALKKINRDHTRMLIRVHEPYIRFSWWPIPLFLVGQMQRLIIRRLGRVADRMVTSIELYKHFIEKYSNVPVEIIPIPSNIQPIHVSNEELQDIRKKVAGNGERIVSTFGIRNHELLVTVFQEVLRRHPNSKLLVCGKVKDEKLYEPVREHVFVTGYLANNDVFKYLKCSDVFFLPDDVSNEGIGGTSNKSTSLAAALAADLPVIGIKGDMNNELLMTAKSVYLENAERETIAERIIQVFNSPNNAHQSYLFWKEHLCWERIIEKYGL